MLIAYIPVLHVGYIRLLAEYDELGILGPDIVCEFTSLERDVRAVDPYRMKSAIEGAGVIKHVRVLTADDLLELRHRPLVMVDDDVSHALADRYGLNVTFVPMFLRWDKMAATMFKTPNDDRAVSLEELDREMMLVAKAEAQRSADWWRQIGAVITKNGNIVAQGHNHHLPSDNHLVMNGDPRSNFDAGERQDIYTSIHAEASLIAKAAHDGVSLNGAAIYATTFPCPNCARLIAVSGMTRVYFSDGYSLLDAQEIFKAFNVECIRVDLADTNAHPDR